jgi:hypothetical protein
MVQDISVVKSIIERHLLEMNVGKVRVTITKFDTDKQDPKLIHQRDITKSSTF